MLDIKKGSIPKLLDEKDLYTSKNDEIFWIKGFVADKKAHVTLLYGLMKSGKIYEKYIKKLLKNWKLDSVEVERVDYFEGQLENEPNYCIVAHIKVTPKLLEGHERLQFLPHIDTFPGYKPHMTIAYVKKNEKIRDRAIALYSRVLVGKRLKITGLNLGGKE